MSKHKTKKNLIGSIVFYVMTAILMFFIAVNIIVPDKSVNIIGFQLSVIPSGSMKPHINVGDIIIMSKVDVENINEDDIIVYYNYIDPNQDGVYTKERVVHRVITVNDSGSEVSYITRGDNNSSNDVIRDANGTITTLKNDQIIAQVKQIGQNNWALRIPYIGYVVLVLQWLLRFLFANPIFVILLVINISIIVALIILIKKNIREKAKEGQVEESNRVKANDVTDNDGHDRNDDEEDGSV